MTAKDTLRDYDLRQTDCREGVLDLFLGKEYALSQGDLENQTSDKFDRVTVYRTLKTFLDKGLIHKVLDNDGGIKYALCKEPCHRDEHHNHDHVHFKCEVCGLTNCIENIHIPNITLPDGYIRKEVNLLIQGICPKCNSLN